MATKKPPSRPGSISALPSQPPAGHASAPHLVSAIDLGWRTHDFALDGGAITRCAQDWLLTNGTGAFAMGSVPGVNQRRYHGLLVASTRPPVGRVVALNQVLEQLVLKSNVSNHKLEFATCQFPGTNAGEADTFAPAGHAMLRRFQKGLSVSWMYTWGKVQFIRELFLHWNQQAATIRYVVRGLHGAATTAELRLSPMVTLRDFHSLLHKDQAGNFSIDSRIDGVTVQREGGAAQSGGTTSLAVTFRCPQASRFDRARDWWYNLVYRAETERGQDDREDNFVPGTFEVTLDPTKDEQVITLTAALGLTPANPIDGLGNARQNHLAPILAHVNGAAGSGAVAPSTPPQPPAHPEPAGSLDLAAVRRALVIAADDFVVERTIKGRKLSTILAGYPWFADWGRDTFIALPGLLIETGRYAEARSTLQVFAESIRDGLVPNRFDDYDDNAAHYNTVDASLWFIHAALRYVEASGDADSWNTWLSAACLSIMEAYIKGTGYDIRMAGDGLITAGNASTQLTWMDAATGGVVFTPRHGKAVEINALWYAALTGLSAALKSSNKSTSDHFDKLAARVKRAFAKTFWNEQHNYLADVVWTDEQGVDHRDDSMRPNQIFAVSLPDSPIPLTLQKQVLAAVKARLLTPKGLRTLPQDHPSYRGRYTGGFFERDSAYHQGTVWAWLIGPYVEAVLRAGKFSEAARTEALAALRPLLDDLLGEGIGQLHEIYEADAPHRAVGCVAQAWSISEALRALRLITAK
jgi:glycogen debranching enzyme